MATVATWFSQSYTVLHKVDVVVAHLQYGRSTACSLLLVGRSIVATRLQLARLPRTVVVVAWLFVWHG
jgi:hypothetical protein